MLQKEIENRLMSFQDPFLFKPLAETKSLKRILVKEEEVEIDIVFPYPIESIKTNIQEAIEHHLSSFITGKKLILHLRTEIEHHVAKQGIALLPNVKNIIAVASGKGGVGKSRRDLSSQ